MADIVNVKHRYKQAAMRYGMSVRKVLPEAIWAILNMSTTIITDKTEVSLILIINSFPIEGIAFLRACGKII